MISLRICDNFFILACSFASKKDIQSKTYGCDTIVLCFIYFDLLLHYFGHHTTLASRGAVGERSGKLCGRGPVGERSGTAGERSRNGRGAVGERSGTARGAVGEHCLNPKHILWG